MRMLLLSTLGLLLLATITSAIYLWTPAAAPFDADLARSAARNYEVRLLRDRFGVPHLYGERDADVAFGLAYAHAEDDLLNIQTALRMARGRMALATGEPGAIIDYLAAAFGVAQAVEARYASDLTADTRALLDGYSAGLNLFCADHPERCDADLLPFRPEDVVAGFLLRTPFFFGLDGLLSKLFAGTLPGMVNDPAAQDVSPSNDRPTAAIPARDIRQQLFGVDAGVEVGSNAIAVAPARSADGHTRLFVNSHQPYAGPVAWYEARVHSQAGWNMIGGVFPGTPVILHGVGPDLGWAMTVNHPDLADVYRLEVDDETAPTRYRLDEDWLPLEVGVARFRVRLFGPFSLPVTRPTYRSKHGPVFVTDHGVYAISFAGDGELRGVEQWYRMNRATDFERWRAAMAMQAIPSFNLVYADRTGTIAYVYNAAIPDRSATQDWSMLVDGTRSDLLWRGTRPFGSAPQVFAPSSGYVVNANHQPFLASAAPDNPLRADFPPHYGIPSRITNRGLRLQALYGADRSITAAEFRDYKMDKRYASESRPRRFVDTLLADTELRSQAAFAEPLSLLAAWDGSVTEENREAALALRAAQLAGQHRLVPPSADHLPPPAALAQAAEELRSGFGRLDPRWGEFIRLRRGALDLPLAGGPDTLRAVYAQGNPGEGPLTAVAGDCFIVYADWDPEGMLTVETIHQFGAATLDPQSPHYADQAPLFAREAFKQPPMTLAALVSEAVVDRVLGGTTAAGPEL